MLDLNVTYTYPFSSCLTSSIPNSFNSSMSISPNSNCPLVLGQVLEFSSDLVSIPIYFINLSTILSIYTTPFQIVFTLILLYHSMNNKHHY